MTRYCLALFVLFTHGAFASDGVIEISAATTLTEPGSYIVTDNITGSPPLAIEGTNITVNLNGMVLTRNSGRNGAVVEIENSQSVTVAGGRVNGTTETGLDISDSDGVVLEDLQFSNASTGIDIANTHRVRIKNVTINNEMPSFARGISLSQCTNVIVTACVVQPRNSGTTASGILVDRGADVLVFDCIVHVGGQVAIGLGNGTDSSCVRDCKVSGTTGNNSTTDGGIFVRGSNNRVVNNEVLDCNLGITCASASHTMITGNRISGSTVRAITFWTSSDFSYYGSNIMVNNASTYLFNGTNNIDMGGNLDF